MNLQNEISDIKGVGEKYKKNLSKINIKTVEDLLLHIPYRYDDLSNIKNISDLFEGETATVIGEVLKIDNIYTRYGKRLTKAVIKDNTGKLDLIWFNQHYIKNSLPIGSQISVSGKAEFDKNKFKYISPNWEVVKNGQTIHTTGIVPVYNLTEGISQKWIRMKIKEVLDVININEILPKYIIDENKLLSRSNAFDKIHFPKNLNEVEDSRRTLSFEEMIFLHLRGIKLKKDWQKKVNGHKIEFEKNKLEEFIKNLPFTLTKSQLNVMDEILEDLKSDVPMNRLLQGDVGSGKTVVAAAAIAAAATHNTIYLAPTQILAKQTYASLKSILSHTNIQLKLITSDTKDISNLDELSSTLIIGTHSILFNLEKFKNIGLIVIDEQHKFGVHQRSKIVEYYTNEKTPNLLTMTATPIPRSLALTFYGDLKLSEINELPKNRLPIKTWLVNEDKRMSAYNWINEQIETKNTQVYVVCPFIEESEVENLLNVKSATKEFEKISKYFPNCSIGLLHGKLKANEKDEVLRKFKDGKTNILVTTPVIEVGIDIPNANIILIETPERFGLASLHQLRGRVGRSKDQGFCILLPSTTSPNSIKRLKYLETIHNGNRLAELDMQNRGPGDIYGAQQHGFADLKVADITDINSIKKTKIISETLFDNLDEYPEIKAKLDRIIHIRDN